MNQKIAVLTSGGDAPGMNASLRSVIRTAYYLGWEPYVVYDGFKGLYENNIKKVDRSFVSNVLNSSGTIIGTSRFEKFREKACREKALLNLKNKNINNLIIIGGDGSIKAASKIADENIKIICVPATIDNDINVDGNSLGFDTALNTIVKMLDNIRATTSSHNRCSIVEVMGRYCPDLALYSSLSCGADFVITNENKIEFKEITKSIKKMREMKKREILVVVSENILDIQDFAKKIEKNTNIETRSSKLGYIQRGGTPSSSDRFLGTVLGSQAVLNLAKGEEKGVVYFKNNKVLFEPFDALFSKNKKQKDKLLYNYLKMVG